MKEQYCKACRRVTGFKRTIGIGTLIMILITGGWWILAIPFYQKHCAICGCTK